MNIIVVVWSIQIGGAETFAVDLCNHLRQKGHNSYIFPVLANWDKKFYDHIQSQGITILSPFRLPVIDWIAWKINRLSLFLGLGSFRDGINKRYFKYVVRAKNIEAAVGNSLIADNFTQQNLNKNVPYLVIEHGEYSYSVIDNEVINDRGLRHANAVVSVSKWCQQILQERWKITSKLIYNGLLQAEPYQQQADTKSDKFTFCMIGRGKAYKGWEEAIMAFIKVRTIYNNCELLLIGDGEDLRVLKEKFSLEKNIIFTGRLINPQEHLSKIDVGLVLSRKYEAFGLVLLNFFHYKKPVIATNVGAIPEIVDLENKPAGILVDVDDTGRAKVDQLVNAMIDLYKNLEERVVYANRSTQIAEYFTFEKTGNEYEKLLHQLINNG